MDELWKRTAADLNANASKIPTIEMFLEGAGVSKEYIEFFRSRIGKAIEFYFIRVSSPTAQRIKSLLASCIVIFVKRTFVLAGDRGSEDW